MFGRARPCPGELHAITLNGDAGLALSLACPNQNAPISTAPTKANATQTASTFNLTARSADIGLLVRLDDLILSEGGSEPKEETCCIAGKFLGNLKNPL